MSDRPRPSPGSPHEAHSPPQRLDVRIRTVLSPHGPPDVAASVFCARRERSMSLPECATCEASAGVRVGGDGRPSQLLCHFTPLDEPTPARSALGRDDELAAKLAVPIAGVMTRDVTCVRANMPIRELRTLLVDRGFGGVPVVDAEGKPLGVVTKTDLLRAEERGEGPACAVQSIMTDLAIAVHEGMSVAQASALMAYEGVHRIPVIDDDRRVVGILSALDVLHWLGQRSGYLMRAVAPHHEE